MDFIATLLPTALSICVFMPSIRPILESNYYVSFFGLFWVPYHDDLPYWILRDGLVLGLIDAVLSLLAPRFPQLLKAYSEGVSPKFQIIGPSLLPRNKWWKIAFFIICLCGWFGHSMEMNLPYRLMAILVLYTMLAVLVIYALLQAVRSSRNRLLGKLLGH